MTAIEDSTHSAPAISVQNLSKSYGDFQVIRDLQLKVEHGAIHGLVGLNGSGKTTTLECLLGLQRYNGGEVNLLGYKPDHIYQSRGRIVAIFDSPSLNPNLTVRQSLQHARLLCEQPKRRFKEVESLLGIEKFSRFKIKNLSLGNKRRASIAQALIGNPDLVILDEPFNGLDAGGVDDVLELILKFNQEYGSTFLLSSHQLPYLEQICSHIAILHDGEIKLSDSKQSLLQQTSTQLLLRTSQLKQAEQLLSTQTDVEVLSSDSADTLQLALLDTEPSAVNAFLVNGGIPVDELILQRASLDNLFRQTTREAPP